ncbi:MAG: GNAT family N-acetyltransferase [Cryobacterium sp.]|nr:GNAT family N-acetyltransferase [Cryobacterium sp.]
MSTTAATSPAERAVRPAHRGDADAVFALLAQVGKPYSPDRPVFDVAFDEVIDSDDHLIWVVETDGVVIGYALTTILRLLHTNGFSAQLQELVVDVEARSSGSGSYLVSEIERELTERGVKQLTVAIVRGAASFYDRLGYRSTADYLKKDLL